MTFVLAQCTEHLSFGLGPDSLGSVSNLGLVWGRNSELTVFAAQCEQWWEELPRTHRNICVPMFLSVPVICILRLTYEHLPSACEIASAYGLTVMEFNEFLLRLSNSGGWSLCFAKCSLISKFFMVSALILFCTLFLSTAVVVPSGCRITVI